MPAQAPGLSPRSNGRLALLPSTMLRCHSSGAGGHDGAEAISSSHGVKRLAPRPCPSRARLTAPTRDHRHRSRPQTHSTALPMPKRDLDITTSRAQCTFVPGSLHGGSAESLEPGQLRERSFAPQPSCKRAAQVKGERHAATLRSPHGYEITPGKSAPHGRRPCKSRHRVLRGSARYLRQAGAKERARARAPLCTPASRLCTRASFRAARRCPSRSRRSGSSG